MDRGWKTWGQCVKDDMKLLGLQPEWALGNIQGCVEELHTWGKRLTLAWCETYRRLKKKIMMMILSN